MIRSFMLLSWGYRFIYSCIRLDLQLLHIAPLGQTNSVSLTDYEVCNYLILHRDQWKWLSSRLVVTYSQLAVCVLAPYPAFPFLSQGECIVTAQADLLKFLRDFSKLSRDLIITIQILSPQIQSSILSNTNKIIRSSYLNELFLKLIEDSFSGIFLSTTEYLTVLSKEVIDIQSRGNMLYLLAAKPLYYLRVGVSLSFIPFVSLQMEYLVILPHQKDVSVIHKCFRYLIFDVDFG